MRIGDNQIGILEKVLENNERKWILDVGNNKVTGKGVGKIFKNYEKIPRVVNFSNNPIGDEGIKHISKALLNHKTRFIP